MHTVIDVAVQTRTLRSATFTTYASPLKTPPPLYRFFHEDNIVLSLSFGNYLQLSLSKVYSNLVVVDIERSETPSMCRSCIAVEV
jgi:hypothetical protein